MVTLSDLGTRASEKALQKTSAGKKPTMSDALGTTPHMGKAKAQLAKDHKMGGMGKDCY